MSTTLERYRALREAALAIGSDLGLGGVLQRIVDQGRALVGCKYAALGVLREDGGGLASFHVSGLSGSAIERIGAWPRGIGLLGIVLEAGAPPLRLADMSRDPRAVGFPPGHPAMKSLLAVPIVVRGRVYGNYYLADKHGEREFDDEDEELIVALAAHAGVAIENATLFAHTDLRLRETLESMERASQRSRFLVELSGLLPTGPIGDELPFQSVLEGVTHLLGDASALWLIDAEGAVERRMTVHRDPSRREAAERFVAESWPWIFDQVARGGRTLLVADRDAGRSPDFDDGVLRRHKLSSAMALPVGSRARTHGVLVTLGTQPLRFHADDLAFGHLVSERLGTAIENERLLRDLEQAIRAREELMTIATHELKTPVAVVLANAQLLARDHGADPERDRRLIGALAHQASRLAALTDELLEVARLGSGRMVLQRKVLDLVRLVSESIERFRSQLASADGDRLRIDLPDRPLYCDCDEMRIEQVLVNLLGNALKFSPDGGEVDLQLSSDGDRLEIRVRDRGIGIAPAQTPHVFEPFFRAETAQAHRIRGTGLGLHICRGIVELHAGTLRCESAVGVGSTFVLSLPAAQEPARSAAAASGGATTVA
ncbi:MAG: GAF domain-containing sensor histidine kinase [Deltaproteobacteria bacterium]|nr:GAF domain-containing sensor histidine kinase [Deltaproteobacteria bacterium]